MSDTGLQGNDYAEAAVDAAMTGTPVSTAVNPAATPKVENKPANADSDPGMNLHVMELRVRILGGSKVLLAIDRLACPIPGPKGAARMKESMLELQRWSAKFEPKQRTAVMTVIGRHVKRAVDIMNKQKQQQQEDSDE